MRALLQLERKPAENVQLILGRIMLIIRQATLRSYTTKINQLIKVKKEGEIRKNIYSLAAQAEGA